MTVVHMDDGTQLINYQEMRELPGYNNFRMVGVSIIYGYDSSLVKIESTGEVVVLDALDFTDKANVSPEQLNQSMMSQNKSTSGTVIEKDGFQLPEPLGLKGIQSEYYIHLFLPPDERETGVYTIDLTTKILKTKDSQNNQFKLNSEGKSKSLIAISFNLKENKSEWDKFPDFEEAEFIKPENLDLPVPEDWKDPLLYQIHKDGTAMCFYSDQQLNSYWLQKSITNSRVVTAQDGNTQAVGLTVLSELDVPINEEMEREIPGYFKPLPTTNLQRFRKEPRKYTMRLLKKYSELTSEDHQYEAGIQQKFEKWVGEKQEISKQKEVWDLSKEQKDEQFGVLQHALVNEKKNIFVYNEANREEINDVEQVVFVTQPSN